jgi:hypothetical protein
MADEMKVPLGSEGHGGHPQPQQQQQQQQVQIPVEAEGLLASYANFFRVTGTPEELVLDFGLNTQQLTPAGTPETVKLSHRIVLSFYTAKRLLGALQWAVNRYESNFGVLETDFQKRMRGQAMPPRPAGGFGQS